METAEESDLFLKNPGFKNDFYGSHQRSLFDLSSFNEAFSVVSSLPDYSETPLIKMSGTAKTLGIATLHCKYEGERFGGASFKSLGLSNAIISSVALIISKSLKFNIDVADLINGKFKDKTKSLTFSAATSGNHGYALAWISRQLGAKAKIYVPVDISKIKRNKIETELVATGRPEDSLESVDSMLRRFKKQVMNQEIMLDLRKHEFFIKKNKRLKEKSKLAKIKNKLFKD